MSSPPEPLSLSSSHFLELMLFLELCLLFGGLVALLRRSYAPPPATLPILLPHVCARRVVARTGLRASVCVCVCVCVLLVLWIRLSKIRLCPHYCRVTRVRVP